LKNLAREMKVVPLPLSLSSLTSEFIREKFFTKLKQEEVIMEKFSVTPGIIIFIKRETFGFVASWGKVNDSIGHWGSGDNKIILPCKTESDVRHFMLTLTKMFGVSHKDISGECYDYDLIFTFVDYLK